MTAQACAALLASLTISAYDAPSDKKVVIIEACNKADKCATIKVPKDQLESPDLDKHLTDWLAFNFCSKSK